MCSSDLAVVGRVADRVAGACVLARGAEEAGAQIHAQWLKRDGLGGAGLAAGAAPVVAARGIERGTPAEPLRQIDRLERKRDRPPPLLNPRFQQSKHDAPSTAT